LERISTGCRKCTTYTTEPFTVTSEEIAFGEDENWGAENAQEQLVEPSAVGSVALAEPSTVTVVTQVKSSIAAIV
jgi:hypothetical protein